MQAAINKACAQNNIEEIMNGQPNSGPNSSSVSPSVRDEEVFSEIVQLIAASRERALQIVNTVLIDLYWRVGETISRKIEAAEWGDGVVEHLARYIGRRQPGLRGFTRANLFRMRQFYETYRDDEKVAPLARQLSWTHNLIILGQSKRPEEREFYLRLAIRERWSKRELERQIKAALFERAVLTPAKVSPLVRQMNTEAVGVFKEPTARKSLSHVAISFALFLLNRPSAPKRSKAFSSSTRLGRPEAL
jgi:predicted nuclease of restriction endonuclease-like (RecB) superfamily